MGAQRTWRGRLDGGLAGTSRPNPLVQLQQRVWSGAVSGGFTRWGLAALNLAVASILIRVVVQHTAMHLSTVALAFIIAGAIGNAVDRIRLGAVIDLFNASKLGFIW